MRATTVGRAEADPLTQRIIDHFADEVERSLADPRTVAEVRMNVLKALSRVRLQGNEELVRVVHGLVLSAVRHEVRQYIGEVAVNMQTTYEAILNPEARA